MAPRNPARSRRLLRGVLRGMAAGLLLLIIMLAAVALWLNQVGVPDFLKKPLLARLRDQGLELQFSRMRLRWSRGIVAENVHFGQSGQAAGPDFSVKEVQVKINRAALVRFHLEVDRLILRDGALAWPVNEINEPVRELRADNIQARLLLLPEDHWRLEDFHAVVAGLDLNLSGSITNASRVHDWKIFQGAAPSGAPSFLERLRQAADFLDQAKFSKTPTMDVVLDGDASDWRTFHGTMDLAVPGVTTPQETLDNAHLTVQMLASPGGTNLPGAEIELRAENALTRWASGKGFQLDAHATNGLSQAKIEIRAAEIKSQWINLENLRVATSAADSLNRADVQGSADSAMSPWGDGTNINLTIHADVDQSQTNLIRADLVMAVRKAGFEWARGEDARLTAHWTHSLTNAIPLDGQGELRVTNIQTKLVAVDSVRFVGQLATTTNTTRRADKSWAWWGALEPYLIDCDCELAGINHTNFAVDKISFGAQWHAPNFSITNLHSELYQGHFAGNASVDVSTRQASFKAESDFDVAAIAPLTDRDSQEWFRQYSWEKPPVTHAEGGVTLPPWSNQPPDLKGAVVPALWMRGGFETGHAAYRGVPVLSVKSGFNYSNQVWNLPDLVATRPEGEIDLVHIADDKLTNYYFKVHSTIDIKALKPLLSTGSQKALDWIELTAPPVIDTEAGGIWHKAETTWATAHIVIASNFTFRGESASRLDTALAYTNNFVTLTNARLEHGSQLITATAVGLDFSDMKAYVTNGFSTFEPAPFLRVIGPMVSGVMEPYHFLNPPTVHVNGVVPMDEKPSANAVFDVEGGPFQWWIFTCARLSGQAHWAGNNLSLDDMQAQFYQGSLTGHAMFDFSPRVGTDFSFDMALTNADFHSFTVDVVNRTNKLEGRLSGRLSVTHANSDQLHSWQGRGNAQLRDGLIWDIPIFGRLSPWLNKLNPHLGESRAGQGSGTFIITNGVVKSDDLHIESTALKLNYHGAVDLDGNVNALVTAQFIPRLVGISQLFNLATLPFRELFTYKITGTLNDPKEEPFIPPVGWVLDVFHPFHTLDEMFSHGTNGNTSTNSAPSNPK